MNNKRLAELKQIVSSSYNLTAAHFDATRSKVAAPDFLWAVNQIGNDDQVFDAGCGNGRLLDYIKLSHDQYLGFDQNQSLLTYAREHHPDYKFIAGDLESLDFLPAESFSLIFCSAVISHIPGKEERDTVLRSFLRLSKPGARLIISFWKLKGRRRQQFWLNCWKKCCGRYPYGWRDLLFPWKNSQGEEINLRYYYAFTHRQFCRTLIRAGWEIEIKKDDRFNYWVVARKKA
jgi:ubiquinone/menaquinone biosynthesis C-methylase UbiE